MHTMVRKAVNAPASRLEDGEAAKMLIGTWREPSMHVAVWVGLLRRQELHSNVRHH